MFGAERLMIRAGGEGKVRGTDVIAEVRSGDCTDDVKKQCQRSATISAKSTGQLHKYCSRNAIE